jgi:ankyrin repeat protein
LSYAAREGHLHIVRLLLEKGAEPNAPEELAPDGRALFEACCANHLEVVELLLDHGANPNAGLDSSGCCLTIGEVYHGQNAKPVQQLLRRHGAFSPPYAMSARQMKDAIRAGREVVRHEEFPVCLMQKHNRELLEIYLDSDPRALEHLDFLSVVTFPNSKALIRGLLARELDPNRRDWLGKSLLHACAENGARDVAAVLLDAGANINARELEFHGTPLAASVRAGGETDPKQAERWSLMVEFLLQHGAATNLPDDQPWATPLAWATRQGRGDMVNLLKQHGAT